MHIKIVIAIQKYLGLAVNLPVDPFALERNAVNFQAPKACTEVTVEVLNLVNGEVNLG